MARGETASRRSEVFVEPRAKAAVGVLRLYAATLFLSALLLFWVQPMVGRMVLPLLGGSSAVWTVAMVFFQASLLAGYAFAHASVRALGVRAQALMHLIVLVLALFTLPFGLGAAEAPPSESPPVFWMFALLVSMVGLPFVAVSATAPALQAWFAGSGHPAGRDPYFLYGASNLGSLLALLGYPLVLEPLLPMGSQTSLWATVYAVLVLLIGLCALVLVHRTARTVAPKPAAATADEPGPTTWRRRLRWTALAFVPSSLLLGVTAHITTDVAAVPLLWVVPLAIYLLTFVLVFARRPPIRHAWMVWLQPFAVIPLTVFFWMPTPVILALPVHLAVFFVLAMVCHGELAARRPPAARLTEFYLWMSIGGALGGAFNALVAPVVFDAIYEFPLALAAACLLRPRAETTAHRAGRWLAGGLVAVLTGLVFVRAAGEFAPSGYAALDTLIVLLPVALILFTLRHRPVGFGLGMALTLLVPMALNGAGEVVARERSFYGVYRVERDPSGQFMLLRQGTTLHGAQHLDPSRRTEPLTYYHRGSPVGQILERLFADGRVERVGVVGLGAGTLACYRRPGQTWTFYEIDPVVVRLASDGRFFDYLPVCAPEAQVVLGDARLSLGRVRPGRFDLLILDAFSSDAIPMHLMTREALALYLDKLSARGVLLFQVSSRTLELAPIVARLAADAGVAAWYQYQVPERDEDRKGYKVASQWVALTRAAADLGFLDADPRWRRLSAEPGTRPWTDAFSNILTAIRW